MATIAVCLKVDRERVTGDLQDACENLHSNDGELVLDLSSVQRIGTDAIAAMERLATRAEEEAVRIVLQGVSVEVYKVLRLLNLSPRFTFAAGKDR